MGETEALVSEPPSNTPFDPLAIMLLPEAFEVELLLLPLPLELLFKVAVAAAMAAATFLGETMIGARTEEVVVVLVVDWVDAAGLHLLSSRQVEPGVEKVPFISLTVEKAF